MKTIINIKIMPTASAQEKLIMGAEYVTRSDTISYRIPCLGERLQLHVEKPIFIPSSGRRGVEKAFSWIFIGKDVDQGHHLHKQIYCTQANTGSGK